LTRDLAPLIGPPIREILAAVSGADGLVLDALERSFRASYDVGGWRRTVCLPGVADMLWNLMTGGIDLSIATNKPALPTGRILRELNLHGFFRAVACRDLRNPPFASKAELLGDLMSSHQMNRAECLIVGDTAEDWRAAQAAGIECVITGQAPLPAGCLRIANWDELKAMVLMEGVAA
jgi:phosphoglycolate phosphatase